MKRYKNPETQVLQIYNTFAICDGSAVAPTEAPGRATIVNMTSVAGAAWI